MSRFYLRVSEKALTSRCHGWKIKTVKSLGVSRCELEVIKSTSNFLPLLTFPPISDVGLSLPACESLTRVRLSLDTHAHTGPFISYHFNTFTHNLENKSVSSAFSYRAGRAGSWGFFLISQVPCHVFMWPLCVHLAVLRQRPEQERLSNSRGGLSSKMWVLREAKREVLF